MKVALIFLTHIAKQFRTRIKDLSVHRQDIEKKSIHFQTDLPKTAGRVHQRSLEPFLRPVHPYSVKEI